MIISDINYQIVATEAENLAGGVDAAFNLTAFQQRLSALQTASTSGPAGSTAVTAGGLLQIKTIGLSGIILGA